MIRPQSQRRLWRRGERAVAWWLRLRGWQVLGRNVRVGRDELDIVASHAQRGLIAVVEVKSTRGHGRVIDRVDAQKQFRIARAAERLPRAWLASRRLRFDVAVVQVRRWRCRVDYFPSAFDDLRGWGTCP